MKNILIVFTLIFSIVSAKGQNNYSITINLTNYKDTIAYLAYYQYDKTYIKDTCTKIKNGNIIFKGDSKLPSGIYSLVNQNKNILFDILIDDDTQNLKIKGENGENIIQGLTVLNSKKETQFFDYVKYLNTENSNFLKEENKNELKSKKDTLALIEKQKVVQKRIRSHEEKIIIENKGSLIADIINLKLEKYLEETPLASNGRPDSLFAFNYYKKHYWDGVDFKNEAIFKNPFFYKKLNKYFESIVYPEPDSICVAFDKIMEKPKEGSLLYKLMLGNFTYSFENSKKMGYDKIFVYISDNYFKKGKAFGIYEDEDVVNRIIKRADKLKPLLIGATAPELYMIKAGDFKKIKEFGFEDAKNSEDVTKVFYDHLDEVNKMFIKLRDVNADYTILVFWDVDCGHCQKEIPKIKELYDELIKEGKNVKVFSVYTLHEGEKFVKYINEHKLNDWINVYDGTHYNNVVEKYDVYSTPVIYLLDKNKTIKAKRIDSSQLKTILNILDKKEE